MSTARRYVWERATPAETAAVCRSYRDDEMARAREYVSWGAPWSELASFTVQSARIWSRYAVNSANGLTGEAIVRARSQ